MARKVKRRKGAGGRPKTNRPLRVQQVKAGVTSEEKRLVEAYAQSQGMRESDLIRERILEPARVWAKFES